VTFTGSTSLWRLSRWPSGSSSAGNGSIACPHERLIHVEAFDRNCPKHTPVRLEAEDVQLALDERDERIAQVGAALAGGQASLLLE
jgi:hypothetical protein